MSRETSAAAVIELTLLTRAGCCLCDEMKEAIRAAAAALPVRLEERDVDADPDLRCQFGADIPVVLINGRRAYKHRVEAGVLRRRLLHELKR